MSDFFTTFQSTSKNKFIKGHKSEPKFLYYEDNPQVVMLTSDKQTMLAIKEIKKLIRVPFALMYCFKRHVSDKAFNRNLAVLFAENSLDISKYIEPGTPIVTIGRAIYAITKNTDMTPNTFHDDVWNKPYFYDPNTESYVYPVDTLFSWFEIEPKKGRRVLDNYEYWFLKRQLKRAQEHDKPSIRIPKRKHHVLKTKEEADEFFRSNMDEKVCSWDIETSGFSFHQDKIKCITFSFGNLEGYYIPWKNVDKELLNVFLKNKYQIGSNLKFDVLFMWHRGVNNARIDFDVFHAGHSLNEMRSNSLKTLAWLYTEFGGYEDALDEYKRKNRGMSSGYADVPSSILAPYAIDDSIVTYEVYKAQLKHFDKDPDLRDYFFKYRIPLVNLFAKVEYEGTYVDWDKLRNLSAELHEERDRLKSTIQKKLGKREEIDKKTKEKKLVDVDIDSTDVLGKHLVYNLGWPVIEEGKTGPSTNENSLTEWSNIGYEEAELLLEYRGIDALINTFVGSEERRNAYWKLGDKNGVLHPQAGVMTAKSHRFKYSKPNMQQVPHHGERAKKVRSVFTTPGENWWMMSRDYKGLQLRIIAILSGDENMSNAFREGQDLHTLSSRNIFHTEMDINDLQAKIDEGDEALKENRQTGKKVNFKFVFGGKANSFSNETIRKEWSREKCDKYIKENGLQMDMKKSPVQKGETEKRDEYGRLVLDESGEVVMVPKIHWIDDPWLTVATDIRDKFFQAYPTLQSWHESQIEFAKKHGYVRYLHGGRRLLPELRYVGEDSDKGKVSSMQNISINSPVQNFEVVIMGRAMLEFDRQREENGWQSRIFTMIHDDISNYIHKDEDFLIEKTAEIMETDYPEYAGVPIKCDGDLADPRNKDNPTYWGYGEPI